MDDIQPFIIWQPFFLPNATSFFFKPTLKRYTQLKKSNVTTGGANNFSCARNVIQIIYQPGADFCGAERKKEEKEYGETIKGPPSGSGLNMDIHENKTKNHLQSMLP